MAKFPKGLSEDVVRQISALKHEPQWMLDIRLQAYRAFCAMPMPDFGPDLSSIDFDQITYYNDNPTTPTDNWDNLPAEIKQIYQQIGLPQAEQRYLAGAQAQDNSTALYNRLREEWQAQGVIFTDTDTAVQQYPDLVREYFGTVVPYADNKFAALNTATWSGGSFIYVPQGVHLNIPLQAYFRISVAGVGQFERTLIIADEGATVQYVEGCSAPVYSTNSLHSAVVEVVAKANSRVRYTTIQNWSTNVLNLTTQRMRVGCGALGEWIDGNIGSKVTMKYPCVVLAEPGARGDILSLATAKSGQMQDSGGRAIHLAPHTSSTIVSKSIASGSGQCNYRGTVVIGTEAAETKSSTKCDSLLIDTDSSADTYPTSHINRSDAMVNHEATAGRLDQSQLFYLTSRGISEDEATSLIVGGFVEPIVRELPMEYASELNRLIDISMTGGVA